MEIKEADFDPRIEELQKKLFETLNGSLKRITSLEQEEEIKVYNQFGYRIKKNIIAYRYIQYTDIQPIKWGLINDESLWTDNETLDKFVLVADRERMNKIMDESYKNFDTYCNIILTKIMLDGYDTFYNQENVIIMSAYIDKTCISPKENSTSHVLLKPFIKVAILEE